ncbi:hypothetical protein EHW67_12020 [Arenibacter aquaticus]|uniref:YdhG-like domain-containing protein n=1 Tax=Arenibacter aquaticus TaxID=2489054 RepID=A0A430K273_9FLAO|nr:DUF1801 domain-containing protein [Arenibacter aquaticus]RTE53203.1 hypothetical protein EHW67_12020 [Arenibacter aquaticus]
MKNKEKIDAYYAKEQPFKEGIGILRKLALKTPLTETFKWGSPVYTIDNKNVLGILAFKNHFSIWFFQGVFLSDPIKVLVNAQEGKTKAMRHWKFNSINEIDEETVLNYFQEAISNQKKGKVYLPKKEKITTLPPLLNDAMEKNAELKHNYNQLPPYKQREYHEYIGGAKQEKTKRTRLDKCIPLILKGKGLHDRFRNKS